MSDDPTTPAASEPNFMVAAELAISELQQKADAAANDAKTAKDAADRAEKSAKRWKILSLVLGFFVVLSLVTSGVSGYYVNQARNNANQLRQQSIASCESGNDLRTQLNQSLTKQFAATNLVTETAIAQFITVLEGKNPKPEVVTIANELEAQIKHSADMSEQQFKKDLDKATTPRDCQQAYQNTTGTGAEPSSGNANAKDVSVTWTIVHWQNWGGYCLSVPSGAGAGTRVIESVCGTDHAWELGSNGIVYLQGHSDLQLGDSGGYLTLKNPGTGVSTNDTKIGPQGFDYDRMGFGSPTNFYWHANGYGAAVTLITNPGTSLAVYWVPLSNASAGNTAQV